MDKGRQYADKELKALEKRIAKFYGQAEKEVQAKLDNHLARFAVKDKIKQAEVAQGRMTKEGYRKWRENQIMTGEQWATLRDEIAYRYTNAADEAYKAVNSSMIDVYAENVNYSTFCIEAFTGADTSYALMDYALVRKLVKDEPNLLPLKEVDGKKYVRWNQQKVSQAVAMGLVQGDATKEISKRLRTVTNMDIASSIRNARTSITAAESIGRYDSYTRAAELGIKVDKQWIATQDGRTRHTHRQIDGEIVPLNETFSNGCEFPADPMGLPAETYNCRCRIVPAVDGKGIDTESTYLDVDGMDYDEWKAAKPVYKGNGKEVIQRRGEVTTVEPTFKEKVEAVRKKKLPREQEIQEVGQVVADEMDRTYLKPLRDEYEKAEAEYRKLQDTIDELNKQYRKARDAQYGNGGFAVYASEEEAQIARSGFNKKMVEMRSDPKYIAAQKRLHEARQAYGWNPTTHSKALKDKLGELREMGSDGLNVKAHLNNSRSKNRKTVEFAYDHYPKAWVEASMAHGKLSVKSVDRGYYDEYGQVIAISGGGESAKETAFHELGHRMEQAVPEIYQQEKKFYARRTEGGNLEWLGFGYSRSEKTRKDKFLDPYMGKEYDDAYELVSMGFEYAYTNPALLAKDPEMQRWIYGMLATL